MYNQALADVRSTEAGIVCLYGTLSSMMLAVISWLDKMQFAYVKDNRNFEVASLNVGTYNREKQFLYQCII